MTPEKVEVINNRKSPIQDEYIEKYLAEKELDLTATLDAKSAYEDGLCVLHSSAFDSWWSAGRLGKVGGARKVYLQHSGL